MGSHNVSLWRCRETGALPIVAIELKEPNTNDIRVFTPTNVRLEVWQVRSLSAACPENPHSAPEFMLFYFPYCFVARCMLQIKKMVAP
jgi:hypothetical protein